MKRIFRIIAIIFIMNILSALPAFAAGADKGMDYISRYEGVLYDKDDGLLSLEANAIVQTDDAYIWAGTYSGLYRFDGTRFERMSPDNRINSVTDLYKDSSGRMWIGTNDSGLFCYTPGQGITGVYTGKEGLPSDSIRAIGEADGERIYVGTVEGLSIIEPDGSVRNSKEFSGIGGVRSLSGFDDIICGVTNSGQLITVQGEKLLGSLDCDIEGVDYTCVTLMDRHNILVGTSDSYVDWLFSEGNVPEMKDRYDFPDLSYFSYIMYDSSEDEILVCAENGMGVVEEDRDRDSIFPLTRPGFESSICDCIKDYQNNIWFASNKQGILKFSINPFTDIFVRAGIAKRVVNSLKMLGDDLYIGRDDGLSVVNSKHFSLENKGFEEELEGIRIRNLNADSKGNLWISTYGPEGLYRVDPKGELTTFNESKGSLGGRFRFSLELSDGRIVAASNTGLNFINGDDIELTLGAQDGLDTPQILTLAEDSDGTILAGSDGGGIYVIRNDRVVEKIREKDGLNTLVVLRIVPYDNGFFYVTSSDIYYDDRSEIKRIDSFPYRNNYDIHIARDGMAWIFSSAGIFITDAGEMKENRVSGYTLLDHTRGFDTTLTANSWNETDDDGQSLLLCCTDGARKIETEHYDFIDSNSVINLKSVFCDDKQISPGEDGVYVLPASRGRIQIRAAVLNYTLSNPTIHMFLQGTGDEGIKEKQSSLPSLEYTNLPYGKYVLHVEMLEDSRGKVLKDQTFNIYKTPGILELLWVRILLGLLGALLVGFIVWRVMQSTIIRRQYEEISIAKAEAERANSAKSRFLANMSHEIRTPINTIMGMDEMILREDTENVPEEYKKNVLMFAGNIKRASELLLRLVNDVLDMSKIESGKMNLVEEDYETKELLLSLVTMIRVRSNEKDLTFETLIDENLPIKLHGDVGKIKQVILNLLTNAVKYTEHGGFSLKVSLEEKNEDSCLIRYEVRDTGIGVKKEDMDKLFSAFERLDEKKNSGIQGTGLGLDISRQFVDLMGGELKCDSVYGEGSVFYFTLRQGIVEDTPLGEFSEEKDAGKENKNLPEFIAPDARILVVDDNEMNLQVIRGLLKRTKARLTTVLSGKECLKELSENSFEAVLLDHMMPEMDGIETVKEIRKLEGCENLPVIALTANAANSGGDFYKEAGFDDYLAKPVDGVVLERTLKKYIPENLLKEAEESDTEDDDEVLPEEYAWLKEAEGVDPSLGIRFCGGASGFIKSIRTFYDTIPDNAYVIEKAYDERDIKLYTVKVHALKSSARIIGAADLSERARLLEDAGNAGDWDHIDTFNAETLDLYRSYLDILSPLSADNGEEKEMIDEEELKGAYEALRELVPAMDYDGVEMVLSQVMEYGLEEKDKTLFSELEKKLKVLDWEKMGEMLQ